MKRFFTLFFIFIPVVLLANWDVYWEPANPVAGGTVTIYYNLDDRNVLPSDTDPVYAHLGYNDWQSTADYAMILNGDYFSYTYTIPNDAENINFVFTDATQDNWDGNGGLDWHIPLNHVKLPSNPAPDESLTLTLSNITKPGKLYWYVETNDYPQVPIANYRPVSSELSADQRAMESPLVPTGTASEYSVAFNPFNSGQQVVDKIKYTIHYADGTWDGKIYEIRIDYDDSNISFSSPVENSFISTNAAVSITGIASNVDDIKIWGGQELLSEISGTSFNYSWTPSQTHEETCFGEYWVTIQGINNTTGDIFFARRNIEIEPNPPQTSFAGTLNDGVTLSGNNAVIALYAPGKNYVSICSDFTEPYIHGKMMNDNGDGWWWTTQTLDAGKHGYKFEVQDETFGWTKKLADPYSKELIWNKPGSNNESGDFNHAKTVFTVGASDFSWTDGDFSPPAKEKFIIYETHIGDFSGEDNFAGDYSDMIAKVDEGYFEDLGINAVEILPLHAFGGEMSWGYNPAFYMAPPNCYGNVNELKTLVNKFHEHGIAVILDVVFNHTYGASSTFQLFHDVGNYGDDWRDYHDFTDDPYYQNASSEWGYPLDHGKNKTRDLVDETLAWWATEYHMDGFRFDHPHNMIWDNNDYGLRHYSWTVKQLNSDLLLIAEQDEIWGVNNSNFDSQWDFSAYHTFSSNLAQLNSDGHNWGNMDDMAGALYHDGHSNHWGPVKYTESHDETRIVYECTEYQSMTQEMAIKKSKLGAAIIMTCNGIPMLYHGQEFGQSAPKNGTDPQPLQWGNLSTSEGLDLYNYYKKLIDMRKNSSALSSWQLETRLKYPDQKSIVYWKTDDNEEYVIAANFDSQDQTFSIEFPNSGKWIDQITGQEINIETSWYGDYYLPTSEARIFKFIPTVFVPGTDNWNLADETNAAEKENLGGDVQYFGKTLYSPGGKEFAIVLGTWQTKWCSGNYVGEYNKRWTMGSGGGNAVWSGSPNTYVHMCIENPIKYKGSDLPIGIMTLSDIPAEIQNVTTDYFDGNTLTLHIKTNKQICGEEKIYVRVAPDGDFSQDEFFLASGSGTDYYANVSGMTYINKLDYYVLTTTLDYVESNDLDNYTDLMTINYNTNGGNNYTVLKDQSLAVELTEFKATYENGNVTLAWQTESETNNRGFNIYRKEETQNDFVKINQGMIDGAGNSSESKSYKFIDTEVTYGKKYYYEIEDIDFSGSIKKHREISILIPENYENQAIEFRINSLYPNPFNPALHIDYQIPEKGLVNISIYDLSGKKVDELFNNVMNSGNYSVVWNASEFSSGLYFIKMNMNQKVITKRCVLIK